MGKPGSNLARIIRNYISGAEANKAELVAEMDGKTSADFPAGSNDRLIALLREKQIAKWDALIADYTAQAERLDKL